MALHRERCEVRGTLNELPFFKVWCSVKAAIDLEGPEQLVRGRNNGAASEERQSKLGSAARDSVQRMLLFIGEQDERNDIPDLIVERCTNLFKQLTKISPSRNPFEQVNFVR
jgi:hypothetical protein